MRNKRQILFILVVLLLSPLLHAAGPDRPTCDRYLASQPAAAQLPKVPLQGIAQRRALLASGSTLAAIGRRYYSVSIPPRYFKASRPVLVFNLHGTGGYPEAEWNDWHAAMAARGHAFIALAWGGGAPDALSDVEIYAHIRQVVEEIGRFCPITGAEKWLMGFSVGSAVSFAVMIRDAADRRLFRGQLAISGAAINPRASGREVMHPTVEARRSDPAAVKGMQSWMYCGERDFDHGWSMCNEMAVGATFVSRHGGRAILFRDPAGGHHGLPSNAEAVGRMFDFMATGHNLAGESNTRLQREKQ